MPQKFFNKIQKFPAPKEFNITNIYFITTIQSLDYFISNTMLYKNKQQIIYDFQICEKYLFKPAYKQKKKLIKLHILLKFINKIKYLSHGIIDNNYRKIMNFEKFICLNNILWLDKLFCQFVDELDSWWLDVTDLSYEPTRIHSSTNKHTIIIDDEKVVQFSIPASNNWNDALILACLINMETKRTLSNIFDHITILMCVLKFNFIDKKSLKKKLKELVIKNYLIILFDNTHKIYNLNIEHIWNEINKNIHTNKYVSEILAIRRD